MHFKNNADLYLNWLVSRCVLLNPRVQLQLNPFTRSVQVPLFLLGWLTQSLTRGGEPWVLEWIRILDRRIRFKHATCGRTNFFNSEGKSCWFKPIRIRVGGALVYCCLQVFFNFKVISTVYYPSTAAKMKTIICTQNSHSYWKQLSENKLLLLRLRLLGNIQKIPNEFKKISINPFLKQMKTFFILI